MDPLEALGASLGEAATSSADATISAALVNNATIDVGDNGVTQGDTGSTQTPTTTSNATSSATPTNTTSPSESTGTGTASAINASTEAVLWVSAAGIIVSVLLAIHSK